jgi:hypothetical protein
MEIGSWLIGMEKEKFMPPPDELGAKDTIWPNLSLLRRWLLYGSFVSVLHFAVRSVGQRDDRFYFLEDWLDFPLAWLHLRFASQAAASIGARAQLFFNAHEGMFVASAVIANSLLWGFTLTGLAIQIYRRFSISLSTKRLPDKLHAQGRFTERNSIGQGFSDFGFLPLGQLDFSKSNNL